MEEKYYTSERIFDKCAEAIKEPETFYDQDFVN